MPGDRGDRTRGPVWPGLFWSEEDDGGMQIALFATCLGDILFPDVPRATTAVLNASGTRSSSRRTRPAAARCT